MPTKTEHPALDSTDPISAQKYLVYNRFTHEILFDTVVTKAAIPYLESAIIERKAPVQIAFAKGAIWSYLFDTGDESTAIYPWGHAEIWFGCNVGRVIQTEHGAFITTLEPSKGGWDIVTLPFKDTLAAFRIINKLILSAACNHVRYGLYLLKLINHVLAQWLDVDDLVEIEHPPDELNPLEPATWKHGVFCSQLVLLFLKACVLNNAIEIEDCTAKRRFLETYTHTCLPTDLHALLLQTWPNNKA